MKMAKRQREMLQEEEWIEFLNEEIENDYDFEDDEDSYEPTAEEIAAADVDDYDSEGGESVEYLDQELRERGAIDENVLFTSKDGKILFSTEAAEVSQNRRCNITNLTPGPTAFATAHCTDILSSFMIFFEPIEKDILSMTNLYGIQTLKNEWDDLGVNELRAYLGLLLLAGVSKSYGEDITELWDDGDGRPTFRATMSSKRFETITRCLRFDNRVDRIERRARDKLAPIRCVYDKWNRNLKRMYNPSEHITVDEQLVGFRGRCPFKQYIPSKPARYGIKIWSVCDSKNSYTWNTQVYTGKAPNARPETNQGKRVVLELTDGLQGRLVVADNFFSSYELVVELLDRGLCYLGTVRKNKSFVPPKLLDMKKKPTTYSEFLFDNVSHISMVSYVPKQNRCVLAISSGHMSRSISVNEANKPIMILDYNKYKYGVDRADQMIHTYTCKRKVNRWPMALFSYILDTSALNGYIIYTQCFPEWNVKKKFKRRLFLKQLAHELVHAHLMTRRFVPQGENARKFLQKVRRKSGEASTSSSVTSTNSPVASKATQPPAKRARLRCGLCPYKSGATRYTSFCNECEKTICPAHTVQYCHSCASQQ